MILYYIYFAFTERIPHAMNTPFLALTDEYSAYLHDETKTVGHAETISFPTTEEEI